MTLSLDRYRDSIASDGAEIGRLCRAHPDHAVVTCPDWTGADLLAHLTAFTHWLAGVVAGSTPVADDLPAADPDEAVRDWDATMAVLLGVVTDTDPAAAVPNWSTGPQDVAWWVRRTAQDVAVHRFDAGTLADDRPRPLDGDIALDGIDEYFTAFVATAFATGAAPPAEATLVFDVDDLGQRLVHHLPHPGPVTTLRGTASELLLGLWHRRDAQDLLVDGDRALVAAWPRI